MTVLAIRLENFMAFADTDWLELRPISLLFGRNSSGKSAIIRALRLLRQSLDQPPDQSLNERNDHLRFVAEYGLNQGSFESTIHNNALVSIHSDVTEDEAQLLSDENETPRPEDEVMTFHFRCRLPPEQMKELHERVNVMLEWQGSSPVPDDDVPEWVDLSLGFARSHQDSNAPQQWLVELVSIQIACSWPTLEEPMLLFSADRECEPVYEKLSFSQLGEIDILARWSWSPLWYFHTDILYGHKVEEGDWNQVNIGRGIGFLPHLEVPEGILYLQPGMLHDDIKFIDDVLAEFKSTITKFLNTLLYIGPIRPGPKRSYAFDQTQMEIWRKQGWGAYLDFLERQRGGTQFIKNVGYWLKELGLGPQVRATSARLGNLGFVSSLDIYEVINGVPINLQDMGFGASQVLPIIVQCLTAQTGSLIMIEQPELHLHPAAQATLADLFIQTSYRGVRCLIETHSEHLLLRSRRRVAETSAKKRSDEGDLSLTTGKTYRIDSNAAIIIFVDRVAGVSFVTFVFLDEKGSFDHVPTGFRGFFSDDLIEARELRKASREMKRSEE